MRTPTTLRLTRFATMVVAGLFVAPSAQAQRGGLQSALQEERERGRDYELTLKTGRSPIRVRIEEDPSVWYAVAGSIAFAGFCIAVGLGRVGRALREVRASGRAAPIARPLDGK